jgi:hypothetical protein
MFDDGGTGLTDIESEQQFYKHSNWDTVPVPIRDMALNLRKIS